jgi:hypothetical protein
VPMGDYDSFDIGQVPSGLFELTLQDLEGPREFGGRVDQGQRPRPDGIDIGRNQVGKAGQIDCNRTSVVNLWKGLQFARPLGASRKGIVRQRTKPSIVALIRTGHKEPAYRLLCSCGILPT